MVTSKRMYPILHPDSSTQSSRPFGSFPCRADTQVKRLGAERTRLIEELRLAQFEAPERFGLYRPRAGQRPMREQILDLVDELAVPVMPRTIFDYALATLNLSLPAERFASLRRDEERAYERDPHSRPAWVVPAINILGLVAMPRLIASSAWEPERRLIGSRTLRVNHLKVLLVFLKKRVSLDETSDENKRLTTLIYRSVAGVAPSGRNDFKNLQAAIETELGLIEADDAADRRKAADELQQLPLKFQLWGQPFLLEGGGMRRAAR